MKAKYDTIGTDYNLTRKADRLLVQKLIQHLDPNHNGTYLDIGCGTGNYTIELQKRGFKFIGMDPSEKMLEEAKSKNTEIDWKIGSAEHTGLKPNDVDGIMGSLTIHHWIDLKNGFIELSKILKPNGKIVIFTSTSEQMKGYWLNHYFPKMLHYSFHQMPDLESIKTAIKNSGLQLLEIEKYFVQPNLEDKFLYCGKQNPTLYFDDQIRKGISSFSDLSNKIEVEQGLFELKKDMESGKIKKIISNYENDLGDYMFVVGEKPATHTVS